MVDFIPNTVEACLNSAIQSIRRQDGSWFTEAEEVSSARGVNRLRHRRRLAVQNFTLDRLPRADTASIGTDEFAD